jgi:hypothetical protein
MLPNESEVLKMTTELQFILELTAVLLISYGFYREADIAKIERKIYKLLKRIIKNTVKLIREKQKGGV